ncbi:MAG: bifunctional pyr operon transcriptional regulator/uracil phosphoribosyltransferase PyrR [Candidatus Adiutrix sp.]|nr:bifunctional pyr operon transcriptional regulator/uracil phosphoribosyltransferase PyrR [Candidatus Adiutrix sp.]
MSRLLYGKEEMAKALAALAADILAAWPEEPVLLGIRRGGLGLSDRLAELISLKLGRPPARGTLDINLYRDDWTRARALPKIGPTEISFSLDDRRVVLVDDVLFTGRTVRAALEALADFGRPARIELAVLVDRGRREMPIHADYAPFKVDTALTERVNVHFQGREGSPEDQVVLDSIK